MVYSISKQRDADRSASRLGKVVVSRGRGDEIDFILDFQISRKASDKTTVCRLYILV